MARRCCSSAVFAPVCDPETTWWVTSPTYVMPALCGYKDTCAVGSSRVPSLSSCRHALPRCPNVLRGSAVSFKFIRTRWLPCGLCDTKCINVRQQASAWSGTFLPRSQEPPKRQPKSWRPGSPKKRTPLLFNKSNMQSSRHSPGITTTSKEWAQAGPHFGSPKVGTAGTQNTASACAKRMTNVVPRKVRSVSYWKSWPSVMGFSIRLLDQDCGAREVSSAQWAKPHVPFCRQRNAKVLALRRNGYTLGPKKRETREAG